MQRYYEMCSGADGWDRYRLAGVDVYDFSADPPVHFISATGPNLLGS